MTETVDPTFFSFDIESDTSGDSYVYPNGTTSPLPCGLDPRAGGMTSFAAVCSDGTSDVVDSPRSEAPVLAAFQRMLVAMSRAKNPIATSWNGTYYDLPFISVRSAVHKRPSPMVFSSLAAEPIEPKYGWPEFADQVNGYGRDHCGRWDTVGLRLPGRPVARHLDMSLLFRPIAATLEVSASLKPMHETVFGTKLVQADASRASDLSEAERLAYVTSDAVGNMHFAQLLLEEGLLEATVAEMAAPEMAGRLVEAGHRLASDF